MSLGLLGPAAYAIAARTLRVFMLKEVEMSKKRTSKEVVNVLRDVDDLTKLITGHTILDLMNRGARLLGITEKIESAMKPDRTGPYAVLGVREDASDLVIKASYRGLQKRFHPDTGLEPDDVKSKAINQALDEIQGLRGRKL